MRLKRSSMQTHTNQRRSLDAPPLVYTTYLPLGGSMDIEVVKWRNSCAVRLPATVMKDLGIELGDRLELETLDGNIVLKPARKSYRLQELLALINKENLQPLVDFGAPVGRE